MNSLIFLREINEIIDRWKTAISSPQPNYFYLDIKNIPLNTISPSLPSHQEKLAGYKARYGGISECCEELLGRLEDVLPRAATFVDIHERLLDWMSQMEPELRAGGGKELTPPEAEAQVEVSMGMESVGRMVLF